MKHTVHQLVHGYKKGHSLLAGSCVLPKAASEVATEQSDLSGPLPAGVSIPAHLTAYPLPDTDFYALGRIWPDPDAPRPGCVITHTLLIPADAWDIAVQPAAYLRLHKRPDTQSLDAFRHGLEPPANVGSIAELDWLKAQDADEFAAKVFAEGLRSVVWFECEAPDDLVMTFAGFLWPSLRRTLYAHTFSLHAHAKVQNDLQLHFAPRGAQSHFSRVPKQCHMNSGAGSGSESEQGWTREISEDLRAGRPRDSYLDGLRRYGHLLGREPSAVRNLFALRDLGGRMSHTPTAAVGILDIIDSLEPTAARAVTEKRSALDAAVSAALDADTSTMLRCLSLVDTRLHRPSFAAAGSGVQSSLKDSVEEIVAKEPRILIETLGHQTPSENSPFWQGVLAGMRKAAEARPDALEFLAQAPAIASFVISESPSLARTYLHSRKDHRSDAISQVIQWVHHVERDEQRRHVRRELLAEAIDDESVTLLEELLRDISNSDVDDTLNVLAKSTDGFCAASIRRVVMDFVCQRFPAETIHWGQRSGLVRSGNASEVVAEAFPLSQEGLDRVLATSWMTPDDRSEVWSAFVERMASKQLPQWFVRHASEDVEVVEPFAECSVLSARAARALQTIGEQCHYLPLVRSKHFEAFIAKSDDRGLATLFAPKAGDSAIAEHIAGRIDGDRMLSALSVAPCVALWCDQISEGRIHSRLVSTSDRDAWQRAWTTLSILPAALFGKVAGHQIVFDFTRSFRASWTEEVAQAWSHIVVRAHEELPYETALQLDMQSMSFCLSNSRLPVSRVMREAFPPVYNAVAAGKASRVTDEMFGYFDWDKAKTLRKDIIDTYVSSCWPAEDLALIAAQCQILRKVIHRLKRKWGGDAYIRKMVEGLQNIGTRDANEIRTEVSTVINDPEFFEPWD